MTGAAGGERSRLVRALALSRRFHLYLARCASPRAADALVAELTAELPRLGRPEVRLVRLEPYSGRTEDTPLTDGELADRVLLPLLDPPEALRGAIHFVDASRAAYADTASWARFFSLWNEKRNVLGPSRGEVVVMLPAALAPVFASTAPDVWSIRSGEYVIDERGSARDDGLEAYEPGSRSFVGAAPAAASVVATASEGAAARVEVALQLLRAVPPLALFGGDLVVRPWVEDLRSAVAAREISDPSEYELRGMDDIPPPLVARRKLRLAGWKLATRRFSEAEELYAELISRADGDDAELTAHALSGLSMALAVTGRAAEASGHGARALSLVGFERGGDGLPARLSPDVTARALRANALVQWCLGHLTAAEELDRALASVSQPSSARLLSRVLRLAERGQVGAAEALLGSGTLPPSPRLIAFPDDISLIVHIDVLFARGEIDAARLGLASLLSGVGDASVSLFDDDASLADRCEITAALIEILRGDEEEASKLLARPMNASSLSSHESEPEGGSRAGAFHALASGILAWSTQGAQGASTWFERALRHVSAWGLSGLDFRSRMRARAAVALLWIAVQPQGEPWLAAARDVVDQAEALLGDTAEDHMSRAIAVAAHREFARRLASAGAGDARSAAQRAAALAEPLGGLGVPAWDELVRAAARPS
ncbi:hypothetical protein ACSRUE_32150 [Sorangium sp. KYC3313]|uniref:hypothetical protein n=1 Tax=Sorangium sp. KYC3313 TaxID=3449740 RepID=UPI003F8B0C45